MLVSWGLVWLSVGCVVYLVWVGLLWLIVLDCCVLLVAVMFVCVPCLGGFVLLGMIRFG